MAEGGGGQKEAPVGVGAPGSGTPRIVEGSIVRPAGQTQRPVERGRQLVPQQGNGRENNWLEQDIPYEELVGNIRHLVEQARERHQKGHPDASFSANEPFEPAEWLGWHLRNEVGKVEDGSETQHQIYDLSTAWDAQYYTRYPTEGGRWSQMVKGLLEARVDRTKQTSLILPPKSVTLLDAMAEAAGLPRKRGEATIDLSSFARPSGNNQPQITGK